MAWALRKVGASDVLVLAVVRLRQRLSTGSGEFRVSGLLL